MDSGGLGGLMGSTVWVVEVLVILGVSYTMLGFGIVVSTGVILGVSCTRVLVLVVEIVDESGKWGDSDSTV